MRTRTARAATCVAALVAAVFLFGWGGPARSATSDTTAHWPTASQITVGHSSAVTGSTDRSDRTVRLQHRTLGGWRTVATGRADSGGRYRLALPTKWLGTRTYRVLGAHDASSTRQLTVRPSYTPRGLTRHYAFLNRTMTRWNPCQTLGYRVSGRLPSGALGDVRTAFRMIGQATGYRFAYRGRAARIPQYDGNAWYPSDTQIVIGWATP